MTAIHEQDNPHNLSWTYDSLADEVHIYFVLEGVRHHIEHDVARCSCLALSTRNLDVQEEV